MISELVEAIASPWSLVWVLVVFGFLPGFALRALVKIYPHDDPRRRELLAQLYVLKRFERLLFAAEQLETVLFEGLGAAEVSSSKQQKSGRVAAIDCAQYVVRVVPLRASYLLRR